MDTTTRSPARRRLLAYGTACLVLAVSFCMPAALNAAITPDPLALEPPEPTGPHAVGRTEMYLTQPGREHPWIPAADERELMVSLYYPAEPSQEHARAPYLTPGAAGYLVGDLEQVGLSRDAIDTERSRAHALADVPVAEGADELPVVLYSHGFQQSRLMNAQLNEELASHGYVVLAIDHSYEAAAVDLPDGRILRDSVPDHETPTMREAMDERVADTRFVLDSLEEMAEGRYPDASGAEPPEGLLAALDTGTVGMFGHSAGGFTSARAMLADERLSAGLNLDGSLAHHVGNQEWDEVTTRGVARPFALVGAGVSGLAELPHTSEHHEDYALFVEGSDSVLELYLPRAEHMSLTDSQWIWPALRASHSPSSPSWEASYEATLNTIPPKESIRTQRAYVRAFFDRHLRGERAPLLDGPSPDFPEMEFVEHD